MKFRTFEQFPDGSLCPVCNTNENKECFLMPISGTGDGNVCEAAPVHLSCFEEEHNFCITADKDIIFWRLKQDGRTQKQDEDAIG